MFMSFSDGSRTRCTSLGIGRGLLTASSFKRTLHFLHQLATDLPVTFVPLSVGLLSRFYQAVRLDSQLS